MLKGLKSLFIIEEEEVPQDKKLTEQASKQPHSKVIPESEAGKPGQVSSKFMEVLLTAMEKANLDGFDYLEYKKSLQSLANMPMDEATKFKSAFAMAQTMGVSTEQLVTTAEHYINQLSREEQKFEKALVSQKERQIGTKLKQVKQLEDLVQQKAEQIKKLTIEIEKHQAQVADLKTQLQDASHKIETTKNDFIASYNQLVAQIEQDVEKIKQYLVSS